MSYTADCIKTHLPAVVELLADTVINPKLQEHEMTEEVLPSSLSWKESARAFGLVMEKQRWS
jgi:predicted Zn-dependent peptidase